MERARGAQDKECKRYFSYIYRESFVILRDHSVRYYAHRGDRQSISSVSMTIGTITQPLNPRGIDIVESQPKSDVISLASIVRR